MPRAMSSRPCLILLGLLCLTTALPGQARTISLTAAEMEITLPDTWKVEIDRTTVSAATEDQAVSLAITLAEGQNVTEVIRNAIGEIIREVGPLENPTEPTDFKVHGLDAVEISGGAMDGQLNITLSVIFTPNQKYLLIHTFVATSFEQKYQKEIATIAGSLKPLRRR